MADGAMILLRVLVLEYPVGRRENQIRLPRWYVHCLLLDSKASELGTIKKGGGHNPSLYF